MTTIAPDQRLTSPPNVALLGTTTAGHAVVHWFGQAFPVLLAEMVATLGISTSGAGLIAAVRSLVGALANIPVGVASDRWASKRAWFLAASIIWFGVSYFLIGNIDTEFALVLAAGFMGVGMPLWHPPAIGMLATRFPERRAFVMSIHGVGASVGDIIGPLMAGALLGFLSYQVVFRGTLLPAVVIGVLLFLVLGRMGVGKARGHSSLQDYFNAIREAARNKALLTSVVAGGTRSGGQITLMAFVPIYARNTLGLEPGLVGLLSAMLLGMSLISQPVLAYYSDSIGRKRTVLPLLVTLTLVTPFIGFATGLWALMTIVALIGLCLFAAGLLINALGLDIAPPELASSVTAAQFLSALTFGTIGPLIAGIAGDAFGMTATFYVATAFFAVTLALVVSLPKTTNRGRTARFAAS